MNVNLPIKDRRKILALGAEFDTRLAFYCDGEVVFSENIGDLANDAEKYEEFVMEFLTSPLPPVCSGRPPQRRGNLGPDVIITDLHPLYTSRKVGEKLAKEWGIKHLTVQHHIAHIFSAVGDWMMQTLNTKYKIPDTPFYGIACDGTGYGLDNNIWGGEVFVCYPERSRAESRDPFVCGQYFIQRIGHLEMQYLLGCELSVEESARMLISILSKFLPQKEVFKYVKKYYSENEFNLLWNQLEHKFNCSVSSSTARVLDAVSVLLGFCENERKYKHYAVKMLDENVIVEGDSSSHHLHPRISKNKLGEYVLNTTELFKYLIKNIDSDKRHLGYVAQRYIIEGLYEIVKMDCSGQRAGDVPCFFAGGLAVNKTMRNFAEKNDIYIPQNISCGDAGIAMGQIMYLLFSGHSIRIIPKRI